MNYLVINFAPDDGLGKKDKNKEEKQRTHIPFPDAPKDADEDDDELLDEQDLAYFGASGSGASFLQNLDREGLSL